MEAVGLELSNLQTGMAGKVQETQVVTKVNFLDHMNAEKTKELSKNQQDMSQQKGIEQKIESRQKKPADTSETREQVDESQTDPIQEKLQKTEKNVEVEEGGEKEKQKAMEELMSLLLDVSKQVSEMIMDQTNITAEELSDIMDQMEFSTADLLDPAKVTDLLIEINGAETIDLITDDGLFQEIQEIVEYLTNNLEEIATEKLGLDLKENGKGEMSQLVNTLLYVPQEEPEEPELMKENATEGLQIENLTTEQNTDKIFAKQGEKNESRKDFQNGSEQTFYTNVAEDSKQVFMEADQVESDSYLDTDVQEIMDQIMESMKMKLSDRVTELSMKLHPESLGNVSVVLSAKDGAVSASFAAENEVVKHALETQMIQLKETLLEKGIQVNEIEVKVDTSAFQEQYSDQQKGESETAYEEKLGKEKTRRIFMTEFLEEETDLDEGTVLTTKIMRENGNTMDYLV